MKAIATVAAAAALVMLAGCDRFGGAGGGNANNTSNAAAGNASDGSKAGGDNAAAPAADAGKLNEGGGATAASTAGGPVQLDRAFMMGRWTDSDDCSDVIEFTQDGRFIAANGGTGLWNLDGDRLTMTGRDTGTIRVVPIDQNTITVVNQDGSLGRSTRC